MRSQQDSLQRRLRSQYEALYKQKCQSYCAMLQGRYETLKDAIETVYKQIMADQVLAAMLNDRTTSAHVHQRVKEVFSEVITHEREIIFKKLGTQITNLKFENEQLQREVDKLRDSQQNLQKNFTTERQTLEKTNSCASEELRRSKQEYARVKEELRKVREDLQQCRDRAERVSEENNELRTLVQNLKDRHEQSQREIEEVAQYKFKLRQAEGNIEQLKTLLKDSQQKAERRLQAKRKQYKQKIESYKSIITQMNNQRLQTEEAVRRQEGEQASLQMERKVAALLKDHQRRINELRQGKEKEKLELERLHEMRLRESQTYFQKLLQQKVMEVQENAARYFQRMRAQLADENYLPRATCEQEIGKRDEIMLLMKNKLEQFQSMCEDYHCRNQALTARLKENQAGLSAAKQKHSQLDEHCQQLIARLKVYEQDNNIFKMNDQKTRDQFTQYQRLLKKTKEDYDDVKQMNIKLEQDRNQNQTLLREKERRIKEAGQENEILLRKIKKLTQLSEEEGRQKDALAASISQLKKEMAGLQFKLKDREMTLALNGSSWQNKLNALQVQLKEKNKLMTDLQEKYQQLSSNYQQEKRRNFEIDNSIKKIQMENRFYKEAADMQKGESHTAIEEYKRVILDKNEKIVSLQNELERKNQRIVELDGNLKALKEKGVIQGRKQSNKIKKLGKVISTQLQSLQKENFAIAHYLKTRAAILQNDDSILRSTFHKELVHMNLLIDREKDAIIRNAKNEAAQTVNEQTKALKRDFEDRLKDVQDRMETDKNTMRVILKQKETKIQEMTKENKRLSAELRAQAEEVSRLEKQLQTASRKSQKEKEGLEGKLQEMFREMKEQRDLIVKEYEQKKYAQQQQIQSLAGNLKRLRTETEIIQARHQEEKAVISGQLRSIREQEEVIQRVAQQKDLQIQRITRDYQASMETKRQLQNQNRSYADALNRKVQQAHDIQIKHQQLIGEVNLLKNKCERITEENSELRRKLAQSEQQLEESIRSRARYESELKDIRGALSRSTKNQQLRALNELSMETMQLSQKVNEMRKVSNYLDGKTPLRS